MDENRKWSIYVHTNIINNKKYVGMTCQGEKRFGANGSGYLKKKNGKFIQRLFARAIEKYGWNNFKTEFLATDLTIEEANELERYYIEKFDTMNREKGYNIREGGMDYDISGEKNPMYVKHQTEEAKRKIGEFHKGKKRPEETKKKISEANKNFYKNHEHHSKGTHRTEEFKEHMRELMTNREFSEETKEKMGRSHSPYTYICVETNKEYYSSGEAMRDTGIDKASIRRAADGQQKVAGGLHWIKKEK